MCPLEGTFTEWANNKTIEAFECHFEDDHCDTLVVPLIGDVSSTKRGEDKEVATQEGGKKVAITRRQKSKIRTKGHRIGDESVSIQ